MCLQKVWEIIKTFAEDLFSFATKTGQIYLRKTAHDMPPMDTVIPVFLSLNSVLKRSLHKGLQRFDDTYFDERQSC